MSAPEFTHSDRTGTAGWRKTVVKAGGVCLICAGVGFAASAVMSVVIGAAPSGDEAYLRSLADHQNTATANFALWIIADILLIPAAIALYLVLARSARWATTLGCGLLIIFAVWDIAVTEPVSLRMVGHARDYAAAPGATERLTVLGAAHDALGTLPTATFVSYTVSSLGLLLVSLAMAKAGFARPATMAGVVAGLTGVIGGFYPTVPWLAALLTPSLIAFALWAILTGRHLLMTLSSVTPKSDRWS